MSTSAREGKGSHQSCAALLPCCVYAARPSAVRSGCRGPNGVPLFFFFFSSGRLVMSGPGGLAPRAALGSGRIFRGTRRVTWAGWDSYMGLVGMRTLGRATFPRRNVEKWGNPVGKVSLYPEHVIFEWFLEIFCYQQQFIVKNWDCMAQHSQKALIFLKP